MWWPTVNLTPDQFDRISRLGEQWSLLWDKRRRLWIAAEDDEEGEQIEEAGLDVLLDRLTEFPPRQRSNPDEERRPPHVRANPLTEGL
jgi:hypothetical protein